MKTAVTAAAGSLLVLAGLGAVAVAPGVSGAVQNNPSGNPTSPAISYEVDCTNAQAGTQVAPFVTELNANTTVDTALPTGVTFGLSGTASTVLSAPFIANLEFEGVSANPLSLSWVETIGSTDGNATGSYTYDSPSISVANHGGKISNGSWTSGSTTINGDFSHASAGETVASGGTGFPTDATITAVNGTTSATISLPTTAAQTTGVPVGFANALTFSDSTFNTGDVFTTAGASGETAGVGVTSVSSFELLAALAIGFGGTPGDGPANCLETGWEGYTVGSPAGPPQTGGASTPYETAPALAPGSTTALVSVSPLQFPSAAYVNLVGLAPPGPPTDVVATAGNGSATLNWLAPTDTGGSPINGYVITPYIGSTAQTPIDVGNVLTDSLTGLANGTTYTFAVAASNTNGTGTATSSNAVTPATVPGAPTDVVATFGNTSADLTWTAPDSGGSAITSYTITPYIGAAAQTPVVVGDVTSDDVTGLTNGTAYTFTVTATNSVGSGPASSPSNSVTPATTLVPGLWMVTPQGAVFAQGSVGSLGTPDAFALNSPIVGMAPTFHNLGYWLVAADGGVFNYGDAGFYGSHGGSPLNSPIVGIAPTVDNHGYWLVAGDGGVFAYGDAVFYGSHGGSPLNSPIVGIAPTVDGGGYWLVAADGGVFAYGDAVFSGSHGGSPLNSPVVGIAATADGGGYWLVAADGGVFAYGDAVFSGSHGGSPLNSPVVGIVAGQGGGYSLIAADGGVFSYGTTFYGSEGGTVLSSPIVGAAG